MPGYFRRIYFPTLSVVLPKQIRDAHTELCKLISKRISIAQVLDPTYKFHIEDNEKLSLKITGSYLLKFALNLCLNMSNIIKLCLLPAYKMNI